MTTATNKNGTSYYSKASVAPVDATMAVGSVLRSAWGDYGYSFGLEIGGIGRYVFCCRHSDGSEWFLETDNYGNVYECERVKGSWERGARV